MNQQAYGFGQQGVGDAICMGLIGGLVGSVGQTAGFQHCRKVLGDPEQTTVSQGFDTNLLGSFEDFGRVVALRTAASVQVAVVVTQPEGDRVGGTTQPNDIVCRNVDVGWGRQAHGCTAGRDLGLVAGGIGNFNLGIPGNRLQRCGSDPLDLFRGSLAPTHVLKNRSLKRRFR